ncbi:MAG: baseplate J/gp47 family protein [Patescibacteria group bacterium]|nr:baseplate J/gp47 family protein [Patescibacteria group bacterium]
MATLNTQSFTSIVGNAVAAIQGAATSLVDTTLGSVLRAVVEAFSGIALWLQAIAIQIAKLTRFATSSGSDADSWAADFGFYRLPAVAASGAVTFARFTNTQQAVVPVGTVVESGDGTLQFTVVADSTQSAYNSGLNAYVIAGGVSSCTATVNCSSAGVSGNVAAGIISVISGSIPYVDTVTNAAPFSNGSNAESDAAFRARFVDYLSTLAEATVAAVIDAVENLQVGASATVVENQAYGGGTQVGYFYVIVDDGTGNPSSTFLSNAYNAINAVRPIGTSFGVFAPTVLTANVNMTLTTASGYTHSAVVATVVAALQTYIAALEMGQSLPYSRLAQIAYDASPGVTNVTGVTLNSGTSDLVAGVKNVINPGTMTVS